MKIKVFYISFLFLFMAFHVQGQETKKYSGDNSLYYHAEELFEKAQYSAAREEFRAFINTHPSENDLFIQKAYYYEGLSALELFNEDAIPLLIAYNNRYPENINKAVISFKIANFFFQKEDFENAVIWYANTPLNAVEKDRKDELLFKHGYSAFQLDDRVTALNAFRDVKDGTSQYASPSLYFFSHLSYLSGALQVALEGFEKLKVDPNYSGVVPYYIIQIYHRQMRFQNVVDYAPTVLDSTSLTEISDVYHLLGDAYYKLNQFKEAAKYLEIYYQKAKTTRVDDYQIAYSLYRNEEYDKAIKYFDRVARVDDSLGQIAMYQIADSYQKLNKLLPARSAFYRASEMKTLEKVQEDALYNFAVLSFKVDINPYDESVKAFENYLRKYPESSRKQDIYQCLVNVYSNTSNYSKALESLDKLPSKDTKLKALYQIIGYNYGVELFQKARYDEAITNFALVNKYAIDPQLVALAKYWRADAFYRLKKYTESIAEYKLFLGSPASNSLEEKNDAYYNLGYAYWNKELYNDALDALQIYLQGNPKNKEKKVDACLKLADGYYTSKQNALAIKYYKETIDLKSDLSDRASYYLAKSYGYNGQLQLKINALLTLIEDYKDSKYIMNGVYELAKSYKSGSEYDPALVYFRKYLADYPQSPLLIDCQLEIADIHYKQWNYAQAELDFKQLLLEHDNVRDVCAAAVKGLMDVYIAQKKPEKASDLADQYPCANVSPDEKENLFYNPALQSYVDSNYVEAIPKFETYLTKFPQGRYANETYYFLGNSYFKVKDTVKAVRNYEAYLSGENNAYSEFAAARVSAFYYNKKDYVNGIKYYQKLDKIATKAYNIFVAKLGLMRCYFLNNNYQESIAYAKIVLESNGLTTANHIDAEYVLALASYKLENYTDAALSLNWLVKNTRSAMTAESRYYLAEIHQKNKDLTLAENEINAILKMKPSYNFWIGKALILKTKIDIERGDYVQAEQSLKSVIDFYPKDLNDGVLLEANELMEELMQLKNPVKIIEEEPDKKIEINQN
jgi:tetratricopeptide (TPR) repeat protein